MKSASRRRRIRPSKIDPKVGELPREMCFHCLRPRILCHCDTIPSIENQTEIVLVQHIRERSHPFNTARMVNSALAKVKLIVDYTENISRYSSELSKNCALLYPGKSAIDINDVPLDQLPKQLVLLDGTWNQAKRLYRNWPELAKLPHYKIAPDIPGQYRIRLEPDDHSLSTVEATVAALKVLEPELAGLDDLLESFATMVERQLAHPNAEYQIERVPKNRKTNIPKSIVNEYSHLVVAYGEAAPTAEKHHGRKVPRPPIYWVAKRLVTGETFSASLDTPFSLGDELLNHFELSRENFDNSLPIDQFKDRWNHFSKPSDIVTVYNASTLRLLECIGIHPPSSIELKSINFDRERNYSTLRDFFDANDAEVDPVDFPGRAGKRLANVSTLVRHLKQLADSAG